MTDTVRLRVVKDEVGMLIEVAATEPPEGLPFQLWCPELFDKAVRSGRYLTLREARREGNSQRTRRHAKDGGIARRP